MSQLLLQRAFTMRAACPCVGNSAGPTLGAAPFIALTFCESMQVQDYLTSSVCDDITVQGQPLISKTRDTSSDGLLIC